MNDFSVTAKVLYRLKLILIGLNERFGRFVKYYMSRSEARSIRKLVIKKNGRKIVDRSLKKKIKLHCREKYGSSSYWPWLALYTEVRGEFYEDWIPDEVYRFEILPKINQDKFQTLSEAKTIDHLLFPGKTIEPLLIRMGGVYKDADGRVLNDRCLRDYLKKLNREIVVKPSDGRQGEGILFIHSKNVQPEELLESTDLVFQNVVRQHAILNKIYPYSLNTFRVTTYMKEDSIEILFINLRFGQGGLKIDNVSSGGLWVSIDIEGDIKGPILDEFGLEVGVAHPDTGCILGNIEIPFFNKIVYLCKESHKSFPYIGLIGWDICVDENGHPFILEWNASNPWFWDVEAKYGPLFS